MREFPLAVDEKISQNELGIAGGLVISGQPIDDQAMTLIAKLSERLRRWLIEAGLSLHLPGARRRYWDSRAREVDQKWGTAEDDYPIIERVITTVQPKKLLDIGCGSGRLFPLYQRLKIAEVGGQDISSKALQIADSRYPHANIQTTTRPITELDFTGGYFDLVISNRVLQHITPPEIELVITKLVELGKNIYLNEMTDSDNTDESFYIFKHDYPQLFSRHDFQVIARGLMGIQTWYLFGRTAAESWQNIG